MPEYKVACLIMTPAAVQTARTVMFLDADSLEEAVEKVKATLGQPLVTENVGFTTIVPPSAILSVDVSEVREDSVPAQIPSVPHVFRDDHA